MSAAVIAADHWVPPATATSWTRLFSVSATYRFPDPSAVTACGPFSSAAEAGPPSPDIPLVPDALPAMVYMSPQLICWPNWVPDALAISWIRLLPVSAMYRFPAASAATPAGPFSSAAAAGPPSPDDPRAAVADPAMVYTSPAVITIPNWV